MNIYQTIKTMRAVRQYTDQPVGDELITRILEAGRWTGSAKNVQPWKFIVVKDRETLNRLAGCGNYASHLRQAPCAIVVVTEGIGRGDFDSGRAVQNMMLAAWGEGLDRASPPCIARPKRNKSLAFQRI